MKVKSKDYFSFTNWAQSGKHQFWSKPSEILSLRSSTTSGTVTFTPRPRVTILSASSVQMQVYCKTQQSRYPDLKSSSNESLPFAWITGPTTDPSFELTEKTIRNLQQCNCCITQPSYLNRKFFLKLVFCFFKSF